MKNFFKIIKSLTVAEIIVILTIFVTSIGWVYRVNAQMQKGCDRDAKFITIETEISEIKISVAEVKTSANKIDKNVELLLARGLNARDNR